MAHLIPSEVAGELKVLGERIRGARVRRRWTAAELAERIGVERRTIARLEKGDPGVGIGVFFSALWVFGLLPTAAQLAHPDEDKVGSFLEKQRQPERVRKAIAKRLDF